MLVRLEMSRRPRASSAYERSSSVGMLIVEGGEAAGAELDGMRAPVRDGAHVGANSSAWSPCRALCGRRCWWRCPPTCRLRKQHEAADAHAAGEIGLQVEQLARAPVGQRLQLDLEQIGVVSRGRRSSGDVVAGRILAHIGNAVAGSGRLADDDDAVLWALRLGHRSCIAVEGWCGRLRLARLLPAPPPVPHRARVARGGWPRGHRPRAAAQTSAAGPGGCAA